MLSQSITAPYEMKYNEAYNEIILSIPEEERTSVLAELETSAVSKRAEKLQEQLSEELIIVEDEKESRTLFLAALQLLKQNKISVGQFATLHVLDAAVRTLINHLTSYLVHSYLDDEDKLKRTVTVYPLQNLASLPTHIRSFLFDKTLIQKEGISLSELPPAQREPLLKSFFNFTDSEWVEFSKQMNSAPRSEQHYYVLVAPNEGCYSPLISIVNHVLACMRELTWMRAAKDGELIEEKIMLVPSFTMFQAAINAKANTLKRKPVELIPTYGYIEPGHYAALKTAGKLALAMYLPEKESYLRYQDQRGKFRATVDGYGFETAFAGAIHDVYHAMREMEMSENVAKARMRLAQIAKNHPKNKMNPDSRAVDDVLVDGELIFSYPQTVDTMYDPSKRPAAAHPFGFIFYTSGLKNNLHVDLKRDFIKDMVENKDLWKKEYNLDKSDLLREDQVIYDELAAEQLKVQSSGFSAVRAINTMGLLASSAPKEEKVESPVKKQSLDYVPFASASLN